MKPKQLTDVTDTNFRSLVKSTLKGCPPDPLFTRKVLNSLPEGRRRRWACAEYLFYLAALVLTVVYAVRYFASLIESGHFDIADILPTALFATLLTAVLYSLIAPFTLNRSAWQEP